MKILPLLKFVYRGLLTGLPILTYNPITKLNFHSPFDVKPMSTYINYKLNSEQFDYINNFMNNSRLELSKVSIDSNKKDYYLSINIYNCSVPIIPAEGDVTRCEINTYINDKVEGKGTVILDYMSNALSMDPVNIFKNKDDVIFNYDNGLINGFCDNENINLNFTAKYNDNDLDVKIDDQLIDYSDKIFYTNSIFDKLFYDTSLTRANVKKPTFVKNIFFRFGNLTFEKPDSIFYFKDELKFAGSIWDNLYTIE